MGPIVVLAAIEPENVRCSGSPDDTFLHGATLDNEAAFPTDTLPLCKRRTHYLDRTTHRSDWPRTPARKAAFTLGSPAIPSANHAAPCCQALGRMLLHPLGELRRTHQAGLHRNVSEVRGGDGLLAAICRRGETAEHSDDLDHDRRTPLTVWLIGVTPRCSLTGSAGGKMLSYIAWASRTKRARSRSDFGTNRITSPIFAPSSS